MGKTPPAARRRLFPAFEDLEGIAGYGVRGEKNRILDLYHAPPEGGAVVCFDECGPLELRPLHGRSWQRRRHPKRLRATYRRLEGTEQLLAFYDVHAKCLVGEVHKRKTTTDLLEVFHKLRACYPASTRLYVVMDNLSSHKTGLLAGLMAANNMEAVFTPTYSSWLNAIESHFSHVRRFTCQVTDDRDHQTRRQRIRDYLLWWNKEANSDCSDLALFMSIHLDGH